MDELTWRGDEAYWLEEAVGELARTEGGCAWSAAIDGWAAAGWADSVEEAVEKMRAFFHKRGYLLPAMEAT